LKIQGEEDRQSKRKVLVRVRRKTLEKEQWRSWAKAARLGHGI